MAESGVASGSTIELKSRGRGGGSEPPATSSSEVEIETKLLGFYPCDGDPPEGTAWPNGACHPHDHGHDPNN